jgi:ketosteroid isomerase-like protein
MIARATDYFAMVTEGIMSVTNGSATLLAESSTQPLDPRALADVEAVRAVLLLYTKALDRRDFAALRRVFTADATGEYFAAGQYQGVAQISTFIERALKQCGPTQHLLANLDVSLAGDSAVANSYLQAIHVGIKPGFEGQVLTVWGTYRDKLVRTPEGWRIAYRELETLHAAGDIGLQL